MSAIIGRLYAERDDGSNWLLALTLAVFLAMSIKSIMVGAGHAVWSVALAVAGLPGLLAGFGLHLRREAGASLLAGALAFAVTVFAPAVVLEFPEWPDAMVQHAITSLAVLYLFARSGCRISAVGSVVAALVFSAGFNFALYT